MKKSRLYYAISAILIGAILGYIGGPVQILLLWAVVGVGLGYAAPRNKLAIIGGAFYGFIMSFVFMLHGYDGTDSIYTKLVPFAALGLFGAICGTILAAIGRLPRILLRSKTPTKTREQ